MRLPFWTHTRSVCPFPLKEGPAEKSHLLPDDQWRRAARPLKSEAKARPAKRGYPANLATEASEAFGGRAARRHWLSGGRCDFSASPCFRGKGRAGRLDRDRWVRSAGLAILPSLLLACSGTHTDTGHPWNPLRAEVPEFHDGITAYNDSRWADAEKKFEAANDQQPSSEGHFDEGSAYYRQKKLPEAAEDYRRVLTSTDDDLKERAYFDLGNTEAASGHLEEAKTNYRRALEVRPNDMNARYNLEWAQREIEEQKKKQEDDKNKKQGGGKDDKKDDKGDQKKDDQKDQQNAKNDKKDDQKQGDKDKQDQKDGKQEQAQNKPDDKGKGEDKKENPGEEQKPEDDKGKGQQANAAQPKPADNKGAQAAQAGKDGKDGTGTQMMERPLTKEETAAVLDALQADEHSLQMWKFQDRKPRSGRDKDW
jgi:tetratricopeptide (TPR) repeat protein